MRERYSYFVEVTDTQHKTVSAKEFKELSKQWTEGKTEGRITKYYIDEIEVGRKVKGL
jgi:hypothetical protein